MSLGLTQPTLEPSRVDAQNGVVYGCRLAEVGKIATFIDRDKNVRQIKMTPRLVDGLLALCQGAGRLNGHWTHDWVSSERDALETRVTTWRDFAKDESGNLIANAHTTPGDKRLAILHYAENDPSGMMVSLVFRASGPWDDPIAESVAAADFVGKGAATSALLADAAILSAYIQKTESMTDDPIDPAPEPVEPKPVFSDEQEARILEIVQKAMQAAPAAEPTDLPPAMLSAIKDVFAGERKELTGALRAEMSKLVGTAPKGGGTPAPKGYDAVLSEYTQGGKVNPAVAEARLAKDHPELHSQHRAALFSPTK